MKKIDLPKKNIILWIVLLIAVLCLEAFYIKQNPMGETTPISNTFTGSVDMTSGAEVSQTFIYNEDTLEGILLATDKSPDVSDGYISVELSSNGEIIRTWGVSKYSYTGNELKLLLDSPLKDTSGRGFTLRITCFGEDSGITVYLCEKTDGTLTVNGAENSGSSLVFAQIIKSTGASQVFAFAAVFTIIAFVLLFFFVQIKGWRRPEYFFALCYLIIGIFQFFSVPIFTTPDEANHFYRAYQISEGGFVSQANPDGESEGLEGAGGFLPSAVSFNGDYDLSETTLYDLNEMSQYVIDKEDTEFTGFGNTALYAPVTYLPQVIGIKAADLFTDNTLYIAYAARIFNWLTAGILIAFAIRLIPAGKNIVFLISMLPMSLQSFNSMSPDAFAYAVSVLLLAFVLHMRFSRKEPFKLRHYIFMYILVFVICQCKIVYAPLCLLLFLIPKERFGSTKKYALAIVSAAALGLITCLSWLSVTSPFLTEFQPGVDTEAQLQYVTGSPLRFAAMLLNSFDALGDQWIRMGMGENLGTLDITTSFTMLLIFGVIIITVFFMDNDTAKIKLNAFTRCMLLGTSVIVTLATFASLYLQWTSYRSELVAGIQGRYFLPIIPAVLLALKPPSRMISGSGMQSRWFVPAVLGIDLVISSIVLTYAL